MFLQFSNLRSRCNLLCQRNKILTFLKTYRRFNQSHVLTFKYTVNFYKCILMFGSIKLAINSRINYDTEENITLTIVFFQNRSFLTDRRQKKMKVLYPKQWSTCLAGSIVRAKNSTNYKGRGCYTKTAGHCRFFFG